eukprot:m51a1_g2579 hypothetical protein (412) ;mRNA; f:391376-393105
MIPADRSSSSSSGAGEASSPLSHGGPLRVLAAFDKFKDTLSSARLAEVCRSELCDLYGPSVDVRCAPLSDGGDGFLDALAVPMRLLSMIAPAHGPLGDLAPRAYGLTARCDVAVIEMARASGLALVPQPERNPLRATSRGTGELIADAYYRGARRVLLGVGGTATNDAGVGALQAMGVRVRMREGGPEPEFVTGEMLSDIEALEVPPGGLLPDLTIEISCDVRSPLVGPSGATYDSQTFSGQKGATEEDKQVLEKGMEHVAKLFPQDVRHIEGAGAAGGLPGGLKAFFGDRVTFKSGFDVVSEVYSLEDLIAECDIVFTGEGAYDSTTLAGKLVSRVCELCTKYDVPVVILCGRYSQDTPVPQGARVYDLASRFGIETAMMNTEDCMRKLIREITPTLPRLGHLTQWPSSN